MQFTSLVFIPFLLLVLAAWSRLDIRRGRRLLVGASFFFYAYWFPPFVLLLVGSGLVDYLCGRRVASPGPHRKHWLAVSLAANLGILFLFKYLGLFEQIVALCAGVLGTKYAPIHDAWILPMGISFYTFQSLSYTIDIYRGDLEPTASPSRFFAYLAFFPQLVAGPIVRARDFLPQLHARRALTDEDLRFALHRICRGYFLKVVIADNLAGSVDRIFSSQPGGLDVLTAWAGALFFALQIFCDFAGYSDIAIGIGRLFGFRIPENFDAPYRATSLTDFWRRWHISLSTWFRDYVYIPLGGSRRGPWRVAANILVVFCISGLWHGANWTFLFWGFAHGFCLVVERTVAGRRDVARHIRRVPDSIRRVAVFALVCALWVPFRAPTISYALSYWQSMLVGELVLLPRGLAQGFLFAGIFYGSRLLESGRTAGTLPSSPGRWQPALYLLPVLLMPGPASDFIYFQF